LEAFRVGYAGKAPDSFILLPYHQQLATIFTAIISLIERSRPMKLDKNTMTRRRFLKTSTQVTTTLAGLSIATQAYGAGSDRIRVGLVGCGGRGTGAAAQALTTGESVVLTAMADVFEDLLQNSRKNLASNEQFGQRVKVPEDACFVGLDAYQKVIDSA
jgi:hypothetical protein